MNSGQSGLDCLFTGSFGGITSEGKLEIPRRSEEEFFFEGEILINFLRNCPGTNLSDESPYSWT